ncbi:MAG: class III extradiol dioxygenase subunit B-like domain-containing protein [bacterium]|nr:class III extradiol dioxygenase subunit B-like domain-containing protein [bacterium]
MPIVFAAISPHPPIILPSVGSKGDREQVKNTINALKKAGEKLKKSDPDVIVISSPHSDWGFQVPLFYLAEGFKGKTEMSLVGNEKPEFYFEQGRKLCADYDMQKNKDRYGLIASGDLSHCLKKEGPYGFNPEGPEFDKELVEALKKKDIKNILKLDDIYPGAGECGLRSICFILGILQEAKINWQTEVLSYEGPWGVGYLVANFKLK